MKRILYIALLHGLSICSFAQNPKAPTVVAPSPNAGSLGIFGDVPTGTYTGVPAIDVPIYTISYRDIKVPISLSYHAAGIKVEQEASWVGLGWALNAGGVITRSIRGIDDFSTNNTGFPFVGGMPTECQVRNTPTMFANFIQGNCQGTIDSEPDLFYFNLGGIAGKFIVEQNQNTSASELRGTLLSKSKLLVKYTWAGTTRNNGSWIITDEQGFTYTFDIKEFSFNSTALGNFFAEAEQKMWNGLGRLENDNTNNLKSVTGWYLSKIESPIGTVVTFVYDDPTQYATQSQVSRGMSRKIPNYFVLENGIYPSNIPCGTRDIPGLQIDKL